MLGITRISKISWGQQFGQKSVFFDKIGMFFGSKGG